MSNTPCSLLKSIEEHNCNILIEQDMIYVVGQDGRKQTISNPVVGLDMPAIPSAIFDQFLADGFIVLDDADGRVLYRLTSVGRAAAKSGKAA